jgi:AcrR family transcriptional regulator
MVLSHQEESRTSSGRINQKARTRAALLRAATDLVREGRPPSMPEAAERALISVATAYRYFPTADDLWFEASQSAIAYEQMFAKAAAAIEVAGDDPPARLEALLRSAGFRMLDDQVPFRRMAKASLEQWFDQAESPEPDPPPVGEGRRNAQIALVVEPLRGSVPDADLDRLEHALGVIVGTDAMLALTDGVGLDVAQAKEAMLDAGRWLLAGALAELRAPS